MGPSSGHFLTVRRSQAFFELWIRSRDSTYIEVLLFPINQPSRGTRARKN